MVKDKKKVFSMVLTIRGEDKSLEINSISGRAVENLIRKAFLIQ